MANTTARTRSTFLELDNIEVEYTVDGCDRPAVTSGGADNWSPAEYAEIEIVAVYAVNPRTGTKVDILPALDRETEEALQEECSDAASRDAVEDRAEAMERQAESRAEARMERD